MRSMFALAAAVLVSAFAVANPPAAGCNNCGKEAKPAGLIRIGGGCAMPHGCSSLAAERTFLFGSCKQFFNAGTDCGMKMNLHPLQAAIPNCTYNSYLNR